MNADHVPCHRHSSAHPIILHIFSVNSMHHTHTTILLLFLNMSGTTQVSRYQKGKTRKVKTNLDLLEQETVSGSGICWAICKSAPHPTQPRQHPTTQFLQAGCPSCRPTNSVKALKEQIQCIPSCSIRLFEHTNSFGPQAD